MLQMTKHPEKYDMQLRGAATDAATVKAAIREKFVNVALKQLSQHGLVSGSQQCTRHGLVSHRKPALCARS